jgi:nucleotide sugar dehydrogenase
VRENAFILGLGMVGKATQKALEIPYFFDLKESNISLDEGAKKQWCFICLPTPTDEKNGQGKSIEIMYEYIKQIHSYGGSTIFVVRSTVLPGTCRALCERTGAVVVSNPEFLSESTWEYDELHPRMKVIGSDFPPASRELKEVWRHIPAKIEINTDSVTAEMIKYVMNTFAVSKNVFGNQIFDACNIVGADYEVIHKVLHEHPWGSKHHFRVIDKGGRGAGGRCLPKDIKAFAQWSNLKLFKVLEEINTQYLHTTHKD